VSASFIPRTTLRSALPLSLVLHALLALISFRIASTHAPARLPERDVWATASVEVGVVSEEQRAAAPQPSPAAVQRAEEATEALSTKVDAPAVAAQPVPPTKARVPPAPPAPERPKVPAHGSRPRTESSSAAISSAPATTATPAGSSATNADANSGSFGALGLPAGVRHFGKAFARALPASTYGDSRWSELPLGPFDTTLVEVTIDAEGKLAELAPERQQTPPALVRSMLDRARLLLKSGVFSLDPERESAGRERWRLSVSVSEAQANPDENAKPSDLYNMGHQPPRPGQPGYARFTLNSGRHVEVVLELLK